MTEIGELLNRRSDLSTFVVHFTRDGENSAGDNLASILASEIIEARSIHGWASPVAEELDEKDLESQRAICFSEVPLEHLYSLCAEIPNRSVHLKPYGLAMTKMSARKRDVNPVWYVDMTPGHDWKQANALNALRESALDADDFSSHPGAAIFPFVEPMGTWQDTRREFWWERVAEGRRSSSAH